MTPVENGNTDSPGQSGPRHFAKCSQSSAASLRPGAPVAALALPLLISRARRLPERIRSSAMITGGARNALRVKTPATSELRASSTIARSSRCRCPIPAQAVARRTPGTGASSPSGGRFTAMRVATPGRRDADAQGAESRWERVGLRCVHLAPLRHPCAVELHHSASAWRAGCTYRIPALGAESKELSQIRLHHKTLNKTMS